MVKETFLIKIILTELIMKEILIIHRHPEISLVEMIKVLMKEILLAMINIKIINRLIDNLIHKRTMVTIKIMKMTKNINLNNIKDFQNQIIQNIKI